MRSAVTLSLVLLLAARVAAADVALAAPLPRQVVQRVEYDPLRATTDPGGHADVPVRFERPAGAGGLTWEWRTTLLAGAKGRAVGWTRLRHDVAHLPAGGWYRLEVRGRDGDRVVHQGAVEPVGVGEVFLVAGQSYATNCNDEKLKVADAAGRVTAFDAAKGTWAVAHDPQPVADGSADGSIWPPLGDALVREYGVPVGFANVAVSATSTSQWVPGGELHKRLVTAGKALGGFRAVLWQQGESDVIAKTTTAAYVANVRAIREAAAVGYGREAPWLLAKSTLHPTVYTDPAGEGRIRTAVDELVKLPGFAPGPDTDTLAGENRGGANSRRHFSAVGQRNAAALWLAAIKAQLAVVRPLRERLADWKLLDPAWASPVVWRESSIRMKVGDRLPTARLAFSAAEVLEVSSADRHYAFDVNHDVTLSADGLTLTFVKQGAPVPVISDADLFVPKGSPKSYAHRAGKPDEHLLYRPGRWFHDRDVEVTYRRRDVPAAAAKPDGTLPRTLARLAARQPLTLGVSGDSISTGADASAVAKAAPYQPGYPDLVAAQLELTYRTTVTLKNRAVGGWSVANGVADLDRLLAEKPHLVVVAYGMNDVGRRDPAWFEKQTKTILDRIRAADPAIEVLLVSPMLGNAEWVHTPRDMFAKYRDRLRALTGPGVALADVTAVWEAELAHKHDLDLTGNGLNHPNDFGHRLYAQVVLSRLVAGK